MTAVAMNLASSVDSPIGIGAGSRYSHGDEYRRYRTLPHDCRLYHAERRTRAASRPAAPSHRVSTTVINMYGGLQFQLVVVKKSQPRPDSPWSCPAA